MSKNDKISFFLSVFGFITEWTDVKFALITMESLLCNGRGTNITKSIVSGLEIFFHFEGMVSWTDVGFVTFAFGTVVKLALLASPSDFCVALLDRPVADDADFGIRGSVVEDVLRVLFDRDVRHDVTLVTKVLCALFAAKTSSHFLFIVLNYKSGFNKVISFFFKSKIQKTYLKYNQI